MKTLRGLVVLAVSHCLTDRLATRSHTHKNSLEALKGFSHAYHGVLERVEQGWGPAALAIARA